MKGKVISLTVPPNIYDRLQISSKLTDSSVQQVILRALCNLYDIPVAEGTLLRSRSDKSIELQKHLEFRKSANLYVQFPVYSKEPFERDRFPSPGERRRTMLAWMKTGLQHTKDNEELLRSALPYIHYKRTVSYPIPPETAKKLNLAAAARGMSIQLYVGCLMHIGLLKHGKLDDSPAGGA